MGNRSGGDTTVKLLIEAESFDTLGGWVTETQSMQTIGSAYIMAHGMGVPVADAETKIELAEAGVYAFWAQYGDAENRRGVSRLEWTVRLSTRFSGRTGANGNGRKPEALPYLQESTASPYTTSPVSTVAATPYT